MKALLVTGAAGFIGRLLLGKLARRGCRLRGLDLATACAACSDYHCADLTSRADWAWLFEGIDTVFHLAGKVHSLAELKQDDAEYFRINTEGTRNVLEAAQGAGVQRFVFFSTVKAMSRDEAEAKESTISEVRRLDRAFTEQDVIEPDTPYGRSKLEAEKLVLQGGYVPEPVVLRLCMVYGPGAKGNMQKMLNAVSQRRFPPLPEVGNRRSMVHVQDVLQAALLAAEHASAVGETFIVSDGESYSTRQIYEMMCRALGRPIPGWTLPLWFLRGLGQAGDMIGRVRRRRFLFDSDALEKLIGSAWFSSEKISKVLGFRPKWTLEKALPEMVAEMHRTSVK